MSLAGGQRGGGEGTANTVGKEARLHLSEFSYLALSLEDGWGGLFLGTYRGKRELGREGQHFLETYSMQFFSRYLICLLSSWFLLFPSISIDEGDS